MGSQAIAIRLSSLVNKVLLRSSTLFIYIQSVWLKSWDRDPGPAKNKISAVWPLSLQLCMNRCPQSPQEGSPPVSLTQVTSLKMCGVLATSLPYFPPEHLATFINCTNKPQLLFDFQEKTSSFTRHLCCLNLNPDLRVYT